MPSFETEVLHPSAPPPGMSKSHPPSLPLHRLHGPSPAIPAHMLPDDAEGSRTPRPATLTPSPPLSPIGRPYAELNGVSNGFSQVSDEPDSMVLLRTIDFAARKHQCQRRKDLDQTPYINHPIAVANFLSSTGVRDVRVLQSAILHDTVEDTCTTIGELLMTAEGPHADQQRSLPTTLAWTWLESSRLASQCGSKLGADAQECSDDPNLGGQQRKAEQLRTAPFRSKEAQMVKLADKLHNLESIRRSPPVGWGIKRIQAYFIWAKQVTDICGPSHPPLAERLQNLYETAYTRVNGVYYPCHPEVCGPLTEAEKLRIDARLLCLKAGEKPQPAALYN